MKRFALALFGLWGISSVSFLPGQSAPSPSPGNQPGAIIITNQLDRSASKGGADASKTNRNAPYLSAGLADVVKMFQAGVDQQVMLAFIQSSTVAFRPSAKEIIYLRDLGVSSELITAMLRRGGELRDRAA